MPVKERIWTEVAAMVHVIKVGKGGGERRGVDGMGQTVEGITSKCSPRVPRGITE
jgi:hypothetical protein